MIEALAPDRPDQPFSKTILPRCAWGDGLVPDAHGAQSACDDITVDAISITNEVARSIIPRECLCYLVRDPFFGWVRCYIDPDKVSAIQTNDDEGIEQLETDCRSNKQIHGRDFRCVITQEGSPSPAGRSTPFRHVLGDARLSDINAKLEQFAVDAWRSPKRVLDTHPPN